MSTLVHKLWDRCTVTGKGEDTTWSHKLRTATLLPQPSAGDRTTITTSCGCTSTSNVPECDPRDCFAQRSRTEYRAACIEKGVRLAQKMQD